MTTLKILQTKLRKIRKDKDLTLSNVAFDMGLSAEAYRKIENSITTINADHIEKLTKAFNMDLVEMLTYGEEKYSIHKPNNNVSVVNNGTIENPKTSPEEQTAIQQAQSQNQQLLKQVEMLLAHNQQLIEENARLRGAGNL